MKEAFESPKVKTSVNVVCICIYSVLVFFFLIFITDSISYNDFCDIMRKEKPLNKESLIKAFKCIDTNGDGYITYDELFGLLTKVLCASLARVRGWERRVQGNIV